MGLAALIQNIEERATRDFGIRRHDTPPPPLYAYRVTDELFRALRADLADELGEPRKFDTVQAAAFCLYAAEQFCREHERGPWKWATILDPLDVRQDLGRLYAIIRRGMAYWRRPLHEGSAGTEYLFTLGCEGGLPLRVLQNEGASLRRYVQRVLVDREAYRFATARELAESHQEHLPALLRHASVFEICARLVDAVVPLRTQCVGQKDPIGHLDRSRPGWRGQVPLRLDMDVAANLLNGLLTAPRGDGTTSHAPFRLEFGLQTTPPALVRRVRFAPEIASDNLAQTLGINPLELPSQVHLYVQDSAGARLPFAVASAYGDVYRLNLLEEVPRIDPYCDVDVVAAIRAREIGQARVPGSDGAPTDVPIYFADTDDPLRPFLSTGGLRTKRDRAICLLPPGGELVDTGESEWQSIGLVSGHGGHAYQIRGVVTVRCGDQLFRASTGNDAEAVRHFVLTGTRRRLGLGGSEVFVGKPNIRDISNEMFSAPVTDEFIEWRPATGRGREWRRGRPTQPGDVEIRVVEGGTTVYRARATVFPDGFRYEVQPDRAGQSGTFWFDGMAGAHLDVASDQVTECEIRTRGPQVGLRMSAGASPPSTVTIRVRFATGGESTVRVPFPGTVRLFADRAGVAIPYRTFLPLHRLLGARAIVRTADSGRQFQLAARLFHGSMPAGTDIPLDFLEPTDDTTRQLPLDLVVGLVENILSSTDVLDARVRIHLNELGGSGRDPSFIETGRYDSWLEKTDLPDGSGCSVRIATGAGPLGATSAARLELRAARVAAPAQLARTLPSSDADTWAFRFAEFDPGAWLLTGWVGDRSVLRPLLVTVHGDRDPETSPLRAAVELPTEHRRTAIAQVIAECARDITSPHWADVLPFLETLQALPASTFDVVRELVRHPGAVVRALFRRPPLAPTLLVRLEQLPFMLKLVPITDWVDGARDTIRLHEQRKAQLQDVDVELAASYRPLAEAGGAMRSVFLAAAAVAPSGVLLHKLMRYALVGQPEVAAALGEPERTLQADREAKNHQERTNPLLLRLVAAKESALRNNATRQWPGWGAWREEAQRLGVISFADLDAPTHAAGVLYAPLVAAGIAEKGASATAALIFDLKRLREFDEDWFEKAYAVWLDALVLSAPQTRTI